MSLSHETTHAADARARLLEQLKDVPGLRSILDTLNVQTQAVEDAVWQLFEDRWLDTAEGEQLDVLGRILGEPREGLSDDLYVQRLRAKIRVLRSSGGAPNILQIFKLLLPDNMIYFSSIGAGGFVLEIGSIDIAMLPTYLRFLQEAKSAGINGQLLYYDAGDLEGAFTFSTDDTTQTDTTKGLGNYPDDGVGGKFSDVIV